MSQMPRHFIASTLVVAIVAASAPTFAATAAATLTGTVYGDDVKTPLAGATVVVTDAKGAKISSQPTAKDGAFTIASIPPGSSTLALETKDGAFAVATPVTLAPGETRGVHLALKGKADSAEEKEKKKKKGGAYWTGGAITAMTAVLLGFVAAAVINEGDDPAGTGGAVSPSAPN
jgi:hypothetical protein